MCLIFLALVCVWKRLRERMNKWAKLDIQLTVCAGTFFFVCITSPKRWRKIHQCLPQNVEARPPADNRRVLKSHMANKVGKLGKYISLALHPQANPVVLLKLLSRKPRHETMQTVWSCTILAFAIESFLFAVAMLSVLEIEEVNWRALKMSILTKVVLRVE